MRFVLFFTLALFHTFNLTANAQPNKNPKIVIIGAGLSGLTAANELNKRGMSATVVEANPVAGGRARSAMVNGQLQNIGGEWIDNHQTYILDLCKEFDVNLSRFYDVTPLIYTRSNKELSTIETQDRDRAMEIFLRGYEGLELAQLSQEGIEETKEYMDTLAVYQNWPKFARWIYAYVNKKYTERIEGGNNTLIHKITQHLNDQGVEIHYNKVLTRIEKTDSRYRLHFADNSKMTADVVFISLPFCVLRHLEGLYDIGLSPERLKAIEKLDYGTNTKVFTSNDEQDYSVRLELDQGVSMWKNVTNPNQVLYLGGDMGAAATTESAEKLAQDLGLEFQGMKNWSQDPFARGSYSCMTPNLSNMGPYRSDAPVRTISMDDSNIILIGEHLFHDVGYMNSAVATGKIIANLFADKVLGKQSA